MAEGSIKTINPVAETMGLTISNDDASYAGYTHYTSSVNLGRVRTITGCALFSYRYGQTGPTGETLFLQGSNDNTNWTTIATHNLTNNAGTYLHLREAKFNSGLNAKYQYVRYGAYRSWQGTGGHNSTVSGSVTVGTNLYEYILKSKLKLYENGTFITGLTGITTSGNLIIDQTTPSIKLRAEQDIDMTINFAGSVPTTGYNYLYFEYYLTQEVGGATYSNNYLGLRIAGDTARQIREHGNTISDNSTYQSRIGRISLSGLSGNQTLSLFGRRYGDRIVMWIKAIWLEQ